MTWSDQLKANPLDWLLEAGDPAVRYLTLRDLMDAPENDLKAERQAAHQSGPIARVLSKMDPQGFWVQPGAGYSPKYRSNVWSLLSLAQTGASIHADARVQTACNYYLDHAFAAGGKISHQGTPSSTFDCLQGNMAWSLTDLGCRDERLKEAFDWMAHSVTGEGVAPAREKDTEVRYYSTKCGPNFACSSNGKLPCAWGAVKVLRAFGSLKTGERTPLIGRAIQMGVELLLSVDPTRANYPTGSGGTISQNWWKFGFPLFYISDILQTVEALASVGVIDDPRMRPAVSLILEKQDEQGRWTLDYSYAGKSWASFGALNQPNKWVTLRALRVLKAIAGQN